MRASPRVFGRACRPALAGLAAIALAACANEPPPRPEFPAVDLTGSIVSYQFEGSAFRVRPLPSGPTAEIRVPGSAPSDFGGSFPIAAFPEENGAILVVVAVFGDGPDRGLVVRAPLDGEGEAEVLPPRFPNVFSASRHGNRLAVGTCGSPPRLFLVNLNAPESPREVAPACVGAFTPDGAGLVYALQDGTVWSMPVRGGGAPVHLFSVHDAPGIGDLLAPRRRVVQRIAPGPGGTLAVTVGGEDDGGEENFGEATIIRTADGELQVIPPIGSGNVAALAWQPGGRLLAVAIGLTGAEGVVRVVDPRDGSIRAVAVDGDGFASALWSPDGRLLMVAGLRGGFVGGIDSWAVVDLTGRRVATVRDRGEVLLAWLP